jgi:ABC-type nitrate/sulfonate/bicarbonate transport system substrate-binding protein
MILATALLLSAVSGFAAAPAKYVVGYATYTARIVPLWLAQEQGFFTKYGIEVDPVFIRGAPTLVAGLAAGSIHIGRTGASPASAAPVGWAYCSGWSIWVSMNSATKFVCR